MSDVQTNVAIPLPKAKKNMVQLGCICLMLSIAMFGLSLATLQAPVLEEMNAMNYFSLLTIFSSLGLAIMTPIGGKLGDLLGRRNIVIISGTICAVCGIGMGFVRALIPFMILRLLLGAAQGAFTAAPYILVREINEPKDVPKAMGLLSSSIAVGGFVGSIIAGILTDMGFLNIAIMFPAIPLIIGVLLIGMNLPNKKQEGKVNVDVPGIVALTIALSGILLALNYGPRIGWGDVKIIVGFIIGIIAVFIFVKVENKSQEPVIPMHLFKNKNYISLLVVGFICYFYMNAMNTFSPLAESFRAVSITPAAQATLEQKELGVGTSLVNFVNSLSGLIAAAVFGIAYDINTKADPQNVSNIAAGVNSVFLISALVSIVGLAIVLLVVRKQMNAQAKAA